MAAEEDDLDLDPEDQEDLEPDLAPAPQGQALSAAPQVRPQQAAPPPAQAAGSAQLVSFAASARPTQAAPSQQQNSGWNLPPGTQPMSFAVGEPKSEGVSLKDYGRAAWASTLQLGQDLLSASSFAARKIAESPELVTQAETGRRQLAGYMDSVVSNMSPDAQKAFHSSLFGGEDANGQHTPTPGEVGWSRYAGMTVASFIPDAVMLLLPGGVVGKAVEKTIGVGGRAAATATTGAAFGTQMAGSAYGHIVDEVDRAKPEEMMRSPVYAHAREQGMSNLDAKRLVIGQITPHIAAQFILGGVTGAGAGQLLTRGAMGAAGASAGRRMAIGSAEGAGTMATQAGGGNALEQSASINAGTRKDFDQSAMARALASGTLGGALLGAGGGLLHGRGVPDPARGERTPAEEQQLALPPPDHVSEDAHAALTLALPKPVTAYGPETPAWTRAGEGLMPGTGSFTMRPSDGVTPTPAPEPSQRQLPPPATGYGEGFTMPPRGTPAVPVDPALPAPEPRTLLPPTDRSRGEGFVTSPSADTSPAKPSGGMNRGNLVEQLTKLGRNPQELRRMKIDQLRSAFDEAKSQPEPTKQEFRPQTVAAAPLSDHPVDQAAAKASEPSEAQKEAGNYQKGHVALQGLDITIETPKGGVRKGPVDQATGKPAWEATMPAHYGYIRGTKGGDGEHVDVQLGPRTKAMFDGKPSESEREPVFVVDQIDPATGKFDEHKAMIGFHTGIEAARAYDESFTDGSGPSRRGAVSEMTFGGFKDWLRNHDTTKPIAYKKPTVGDQLKAKRQVEKQRMAEGVVGLIKRDQVKPRKSETKIEEVDEPTGPESQPQVYEPPAGEPTTVVELSEGKGRSDKTTNLDRKLSDLESDITNGLKTPAEAAAEYGKKEISGGRDRTYPDLENYLHERVKELSDETKLQGLIDKAQRLQDDKKLTREQRNVLVRELNEEINRRDPEYVEKLKSALDEIRQESKAQGGKALGDLKARLAAKKGEPTSRQVPFLSGLLADNRINKPVRDILRGSKDPVRAHEYLKAIADDQVLRVRLPQAVALARRLLDMVPEDVHVVTHAQAREIGLRPDRTAAGEYFPSRSTNGSPIIVLQRPDLVGGRSHVEVMLHESLHSITDKYLTDIQRTNHPDAVVMRRIGSELTDALHERREGLSKPEIRDIEYALSDNHELHTMLLTDPIIQRFAAEVAPSDYFKQRMRELGYPLKPSASLWQAFTTWVRRIVGLPESSATLFDHILRPLQDIADRADRYNRGELPHDEMLRSVAAPAAEAASHALPRLNRREVIDRIDPRGFNDRLRRWWLQGATTDGIVNWNKALFQDGKTNHLENYRAASEASAATSKAFRDKHTDKIHDLLGRVNKLDGAEREKLATLMNEATTNEIALGTNRLDANDHLKPAQQKTLSALQARYNGLSREGKTLYNSFRDYYRETHEVERSAQLAAMIKTALPDATRPQVEAIAQAAKTMRGIKQLIDNPDASPVAAAFADAWDRNRALARGIAKVHSQGFVRGDYFPLRRFGDYVVHYGDKGTDNYGVEMFDRRSQAEARRTELVNDGVEPSQVLDKRKSNLRDMLPTTVMDELQAAVSHSTGFNHDQANAVRDMFASILMQQASRSEAARTRLRRQGVQGASKEITRVLARDYLSLSSRLGYLEHGPERAQALAAMRRHSDLIGRTGEPGEQIHAQAVANELEARHPSGDDASGALTGLARKFGTMGYVYSLMSPSHMLTSTVEAHMNSTSLLGARHGFIASSLQLAKALRETAPLMTATGAKKTFKAIGGQLKAADWNLSTVVRDRFIAGGADRGRMTDLFNRLNNAGLIDHSMVRELQRIANPSGQYATKAGDWWGRFMDLNGAMAHAVDVANKTAIAKAAYDLEYRKTGSHDLSAKYAVETARQTMPNYNFPNKARISTEQGVLKGFAGPLTQFKQYGIHMYSMMGNLVKTSIDGASKQERGEARKAFAAILATHAMMAGSLTLIADPLRYVMGAYDYFTDASRPHDYQNDVRSWIAEAFGPELGEIISRGLPHAAGIDIHRRVGLANLLEVPELKEFSKKGFGEMLVAATTGAAGQDATAIAEGLHKMVGDGDIWAGLQLMVPRVVRDSMKASNLADKGVTDSKGKTILPAKKLTGYDIAAQAVGFQPSRVSEFREGRNAILEAREETRNDRTKAMTAFTVATSADARKSAVERVREYNKTHPEEPITYSQLLQAQKREAQKVASPKTFGLQLPKKQTPSLERHGSFANSP